MFRGKFSFTYRIAGKIGEMAKYGCNLTLEKFKFGNLMVFAHEVIYVHVYTS